MNPCSQICRNVLLMIYIIYTRSNKIEFKTSLLKDDDDCGFRSICDLLFVLFTKFFSSDENEDGLSGIVST